MKKRLALLLAGLLIFLLAGCELPFVKTEKAAPAESAAPTVSESAAPAPTVLLRLAAVEDEPARLDYAVEQLRRTLPDVTIERTTLPSAGEALPELLLLDDGDALDAYAAAGLLADLSGEPAAAALLERLAPTERERCVSPEGEVFALPARAAEAYCFFVNTAVFAANGQEAPQSVGELGGKVSSLAPLTLSLEEDREALALFESFLTAYSGRGLNALFRGEISPYDEAVWLAANDLYRLSRANAVSLLSRADSAALWTSGNAAVIFARESEAAAAAADAPGESVHLLPGRAVAAREGASLAVAADSEHLSLSVAAACLLCEHLAEYDALYNSGACLTIPDAATDAAGALAAELAAYRGELTALTQLEGEIAPKLSASVAEGVRELLRSTMTPDEFVETAALTLDAEP